MGQGRGVRESWARQGVVGHGGVGMGQAEGHGVMGQAGGQSGSWACMPAWGRQRVRGSGGRLGVRESWARQGQGGMRQAGGQGARGSGREQLLLFNSEASLRRGGPDQNFCKYSGLAKTSSTNVAKQTPSKIFPPCLRLQVHPTA